ncbi:MAG: arsenate reductase [Gammaproteobacteria bacterium]|nr:arsenate reductase [Gammaproteobacteria bacterium]
MSDVATFYGLKTCDTCRKARRWLEANGIDYLYRDVRADGVAEADLISWCNQIDWQTLLNRKSTTWRQLSEREQAVNDTAGAIRLILAHPTLLKRPVLVTPNTLQVGFREADYARLFADA